MLFRNESGATHIFGTLFLLFSVYTTYLILAQNHELSEQVAVQQDQIADLSLRVKVLQYRKSVDNIGSLSLRPSKFETR